MSLYANFSSGSSVKQMLKFAKWDENVDKEGLGIIFEADNKLQFLKSAHSLSEVMSGKLSGDRALRFKKIGSIGYKMVDKTYYKQLNKKFVDIAKFITGIRSTFLLLFLDRYKVNTLNRADLLPMKIEDYLVIHDGENKNVNLIKKYLGYLELDKFITNRDSELLAKFYLKIKNKDNAYEIFSDMFSPFGILLFINKRKKSVEILHDGSKHLWLITRKDGSNLLLSDLHPYITKVKNVYFLGKGLLKAGKEVKVVDYTKNFFDTLKDWNTGDISINVRCDCCSNQKPTLREDYWSGYNKKYIKTKYYSSNDRCFSCLVRKARTYDSVKEVFYQEYRRDDIEWSTITFPELFSD